VARKKKPLLPLRLLRLPLPLLPLPPTLLLPPLPTLLLPPLLTLPPRLLLPTLLLRPLPPSNTGRANEKAGLRAGFFIARRIRPVQ